MIQYLVTTKDGKIVLSEPILPISREDLQYINEDWLGTLYEGLQTKIPNLQDCEIVYVHPTEDIVQHLVVQL